MGNQDSRLSDARDDSSESSTAFPHATLHVLDYGNAVRATRGDGSLLFEMFFDWGMLWN